MRDLLDELKRDGAKAIHAMVARGQQEGLQLEFKTKARPETGELDKNDRRMLGPILSAFANSAGGLLVIGVDARKNADKIDAASAAKPISGLARFKSEATRAISELLMPRLSEVEVIDIPEKGGDEGYLAVWVDRSERRPHRSEAADDKQYYRRAGDSSFALEHFEIEDAFKRTTTATLELRMDSCKHVSSNNDSGHRSHTIALNFGLFNAGLVSARAPYILIPECYGGPIEPESVSGVGMSVRWRSGEWLFAGDASLLIHPELSLPVFRFQLTLDYAYAPRGFGYFVRATPNGPNPPVESAGVFIKYGIGSEHSRMVRSMWQADGPAIFGLMRQAGIQV